MHTHLHSHTRHHMRCAALGDVGLQRMFYFWEQRRVRRPSLLADEETGCKYQTLQWGCDTPKQTHTHVHARARSHTFLAITLRDNAPLEERC